MIPYAKPSFVLLPYQKEDLPRVLNTPRVLVAYSTGLGKTAIGLTVAALIRFKAPDSLVLIFSKASLLKQWVQDYKKFYTPDLPIEVILSDPAVGQIGRVRSWDRVTRGGGGVVLASYSTIYNDFEFMSRCVDSASSLTLILDEVSLLKSKDSQVNKLMSVLALKANRVIGLDATPLTESLEDMYGVMKIIKPTLFGSFESFAKKFLIRKEVKPRIMQTVGFKNIPEFKELITPYILRRLKTEVKEPLPKVVEDYIYVDLTAEQMEEMESIKRDPEMSPLTKIIRLQMLADSPSLYFSRVSESPKIKVLKDFILKRKQEKILVFCHYRTVIESFLSEIDCLDIPYGSITGKVSYEERESVKNRFNDGNLNLVFITRAAERGLNLHSASNLVFYDSTFSYGEQLQIIGRIHRLKSPHSVVNVSYLIGRDSVDEYVHKILAKKSKLIQDVFEGKIDHPVYSELKIKPKVLLKEMGIDFLNYSAHKDFFDGESDESDSLVEER